MFHLPAPRLDRDSLRRPFERRSLFALFPPTRSNSLSCRTLKSADLGIQRQLAHFIQKEGATVRQFEATYTALGCSRECPFSWPNNSDEISEGGERGAIYADEGSLSTTRSLVNRSGRLIPFLFQFHP